jgi:hypothetical protein
VDGGGSNRRPPSIPEILLVGERVGPVLGVPGPDALELDRLRCLPDAGTGRRRRPSTVPKTVVWSPVRARVRAVAAVESGSQWAIRNASRKPWSRWLNAGLP